MSALIQLPGSLPRLVGKTIARTMLVFHADGRFQLWQFFTDGTTYEFYGRNDISSARGLDGTTVEAVFRSVMSGDADVLLAPDRGKRSRRSNVEGGMSK